MQDSKRLTTRDITFAAVGIALLAVSGWVTISLGPIPFTLQTMAVTFVLIAMSPKQALLAIWGFVIFGGIGLPLFGGMSGGLSSLLGPAGGFISGFALGITAALPLRRVMGEGLARDAAMTLVMTIVCYAFGLVWYMVSTGASLMAGLAACVLPFLVTDTIKAVVGISMANVVRRAVPALAE